MNLMDHLFDPALSETEKVELEQRIKKAAESTIKNEVLVAQDLREEFMSAVSLVKQFCERHKIYVPESFEQINLIGFSGTRIEEEGQDNNGGKGSWGAYDADRDSFLLSDQLMKQNPKLRQWVLVHEIFHRLQKRFTAYSKKGDSLIEHVTFGFRRSEYEDGYGVEDYEALNELGVECATYLALKEEGLFFDKTTPDRGLSSINTNDGIPARLDRLFVIDIAEARDITQDAARMLVAEASLKGDNSIWGEVASLPKYQHLPMGQFFRVLNIRGNPKARGLSNIIMGYFTAPNEKIAQDFLGILKSGYSWLFKN